MPKLNSKIKLYHMMSAAINALIWGFTATILSVCLGIPFFTKGMGYGYDLAIQYTAWIMIVVTIICNVCGWKYGLRKAKREMDELASEVANKIKTRHKGSAQ